MPVSGGGSNVLPCRKTPLDAKTTSTNNTRVCSRRTKKVGPLGTGQSESLNHPRSNCAVAGYHEDDGSLTGSRSQRAQHIKAAAPLRNGVEQHDIVFAPSNAPTAALPSRTQSVAYAVSFSA